MANRKIIEHSQIQFLVGLSATYPASSLVVWDEALDGVLTAENLNNIGGLTRVAGSLQFDPAKKVIHSTRKLNRDARINAANAFLQRNLNWLSQQDITAVIPGAQIEPILRRILQMFEAMRITGAFSNLSDDKARAIIRNESQN